MNLLRDYCIGERELFVDNDIRFNVIGRLDRVPVETRKAIESLIETTESHRSMMLTLAIDYGGREEILRATRKIARLIEEGALDSESIDENVFESQLDTAWTPPPDLLIRTSGELRISNFLLWQLAYSEFYFTERNWPDFSVEDLAEAVESFAMRERRFGETSEQVNMATQGEET
jgi:undecaprenyl diphosphate synthase